MLFRTSRLSSRTACRKARPRRKALMDKRFPQYDELDLPKVAEEA
jgi:hypothetical protein